MKKRIFLALGLGFIATLGLESCEKYPDLYDPDKEKDVSITYYDSTENYTQYTTYAIVDTVGRVTTDDDNNLTVTPSDESDAILSSINENMSALGYVKVDTSENPDLLINAHTVQFKVDYAAYYGGYWDWSYYYYYDPYYWGTSWYWGYPGYDYYYPYYYPYYYTSSSYGIILMEMVDSKNANANSEKLKVVWTGVIAGLTDDISNIESRLQRGIDECFDQSPYLAN